MKLTAINHFIDKYVTVLLKQGDKISGMLRTADEVFGLGVETKPGEFTLIRLNELNAVVHDKRDEKKIAIWGEEE